MQENERIRRELKSFYKELPRCVFQGDENFSNLCVDENRRISGLFDFNMSGTEVIANYLANAALNFFYTDEIMQSRSADEIYRMLTKAYAENTELIRKYYNFTPQEFRAYRLYSKSLCTPPTGTHPLFGVFGAGTVRGESRSASVENRGGGFSRLTAGRKKYGDKSAKTQVRLELILPFNIRRNAVFNRENEFSARTSPPASVLSHRR